MPRITFLWHLHQPLYRTADGLVHAPWVLLHAAGEYLTLARALDGEWRGHVLNLSPVFLDQLAAYRDGVARDVLLEALRTPARELDEDGRAELIRWAALTNPRQLRRVPRLRELLARVGNATPDALSLRLTVQDLRDMQVLLIFAYGAPNVDEEPEIARLAAKSHTFSESARAAAVEWLAGCPARLLARYRDLAARDGIEISTSPWAHPLLPLLIDTRVVEASCAPRPAPEHPLFRAPEDAEVHVRAGLETSRAFGFDPAGCWPPEGAVSEDAVALYGRHGVRWLVTDEALLAASLDRPLDGEADTDQEIYRSWRLSSGGPHLFFRDRALSDFIGFEAARYDDEADAARELTGRIGRLAARLEDDAGIVIALDGENPWTFFPAGGARFLATLSAELERLPNLRPTTLLERVHEEQPRILPRLHPGSWIGAAFATWIGHPEKNRAWELLAAARERGAAAASKSWLAAEGSDWWWWLGDDNPTALAPLYDRLFRAHLEDACVHAGVEPLAELAHPIRSTTVPLVVPTAPDWPEPVLDGATTDYFEWALATWVEAPSSHRGIARLAVQGTGGKLWLRLDPRAASFPPGPVLLTLVSGGQATPLLLPDDLPGSCAVGAILEAAIPLPDDGTLLAIEHRGERLPAEGYWRLTLVDVDQP